MSELPSGTVSLLFSDIEGSTLLLNRLGPSYADALDAQRQLLRKAWAAHGGTELGTEGDSFFVVFPTADGAVKAAAQAQRELEVYPWPGGERVRVRIGIHTGSPQLHDSNYVGMDVHRAARIAGSAHGGQVVVSSVTADLARGGLPDGVGLRDLGSHQLKDIAVAERLFQLTINGLQTDFPALKTIGAASSIPVPATLLVGRDGEVAGLIELLQSPGVRLVTLTGPGGSGKTRLAIAVAQRVVAVFPDGVFFVPLAAVTSADVMWTSIAEVLDAPPKERMPPGFFSYVAHRSALFVLDNLEQLSEADEVVAQLLAAAPQVAVIASSRRALSVPAEHRHPVPPLALPENSTLADAEGSGAVQLFVQQARSIHPDFELTVENVAEVVAICRRLDGLPLAIELSAARMRLLSPKALLGRLDQALDIASTSRQGPSRQKTLRDTIAWSYDLLTPAQQAFFRRLGVFAGGGDLDAIAAVTAVPTDSGDGADPLDIVADLVDASLATITEGPDGEPRVALLETIRAYAGEQLRAAGEADAVRSAHAGHYLQVAEQLHSLQEAQHLVARGMAEIELDNFREALAWTLQQDISKPAGSRGAWLGLRLCSALGWLWLIGGYLVEGRRWYEQAIEGAGESTSKELAACLGGLASLLISQGEAAQARDLATRSLTMARTLGDQECAAFALGVLGTAQRQLGDIDAARRTLQEALHLHRKLGNPGRLARTLGNLAGIEAMLSHFDRAEALTQESLSILQGLGYMLEAAVQGQNLADLFVITGRVDEANQLAKDLVERVLKLRSPDLTMALANTYMNILIRLDEPVPAAHLFGAEEAMRERNAMPNPHQQEELQETRNLVQELISVEDWEYHRRLGRGETVEDLLTQLSTS
jgi:predicted ATPase/class 3 adenylate cyclase